ncbi:hypothetical protein M422DRAFT_259506, partial [Sphaerobolus stellatus SS14]
HECYDALDDFHTQRQQLETYPTNDDQLLKEIDSSWFGLDEEINDQDQLNIDAAREEYERPNGTAFKRLDEMLRTEICLREAGWGATITTIDNKVFENILTPEQTVGSSQEWEKLLESQKVTQPKVNDDCVKSHQGKYNLMGQENYRDNDGDVTIIDHSKPDNSILSDQAQKITNANNVTSTIIEEFHLNAEQERAFRLIANHILSSSRSQLKMYIGGMAGTGKSQVVRAVQALFGRIGKSEMLKLTAPTGSAAVVIGGTTYHSLLCFREREEDRHTDIALS